MQAEKRAPFLDLMAELDYPSDAIDNLAAARDALYADTEAASAIEESLAAYDADRFTSFGGMLDAAEQAGGRVGLHRYTAHLVLLTLLALRMRRYYAEEGLDDALFTATASDLTWKLHECRAVKGMDGTFVAGWFAGAYRLERFALGRLQFELIRFGREYAEGEKRLTPDSTVINIHIPRSFQPLSPALVQDALDRAAAFYAPRLPASDPIAFYCSSWLLYADHTEFLPPHSNLLRFMARFHLLQSKHNPSGEHGDLWRLFDCDYDGDPDHLPADSSLRRAYIARLKAGKPTGHAEGVFFY